MKNDKYLKIVLTIIAICLVWICVRDIIIDESNLYASVGQSDTQDVRIVRTTATAFTMAEPIQVEVTNWPESQPIPRKEEK